MIREVSGTNSRLSHSRTFRDTHDGHTICVTVHGETKPPWPDRPAPNILVEDLGCHGCAPEEAQ